MTALAALALVVATVDAGNGAVMTLYDEQGLCQGGARRAEYTNVLQPAPPIQGCWIVRSNGIVRVVWLDGDADSLPFAALRLGGI